MTTWDDIYKNYQAGGEAWATLSEDIHPLFQEFLNETDFSKKSVFDIGCGTGKYLQLLQRGGFTTDGIDSSETAVAMTQQALGSAAQISCADMFSFVIPKDRYDLIISVSTIHHGRKEQIQSLVNQIHEALVSGGHIFITVPDIASATKWDTFIDHEKIAEGTFAPTTGPEKGLAHSFYTEDEVKSLFSAFGNVHLDLDTIGRWVIRASK
jgi:2-polyprenyl-3-methyl-5-hydroxy-6-metoxy-1,4-benzoquinol methylase